MRSRFRVFGHPVHPMLVMFPVALFPLLLLLDALEWYSSDEAFWTIGFWVAGAGLVMTLVAMVPGIVDLAAIPDASRAHRTALIHLVVGILVAVAYVATVLARWPGVGSASTRLGWALAADVIGVALITMQGWLGGELVYKHHVGVMSPAEGADPVELSGSARGSGAPAGASRRGELRP